MAKILYICLREQNNYQIIEEKLLNICNRILSQSENLQNNKIIKSKGIFIGISNFSSAITISDQSVCLGVPIGNTDWSCPFSNDIDGSFAIFRSNDDYIEIVSDTLATRTIWYYVDKKYFIASSSQRAIIQIIGNFKLNKKIIPWILSSGTLGLENSWDKRIKRLSGDSNLILERKLWSLKVLKNDVKFKKIPLSYREHKKQLLESIEETFYSFNLNYDSWCLPLSGGFDSRIILYFLRKANELNTITWGTTPTIDFENSDVSIARKLSSHFNLKNSFYEIKNCEFDIENVFSKFVSISEGRTDHFSGYIDGFKIWDQISRSNCKGIIRGDNGFGWKKVFSDVDVRYGIGMSLCLDFSNLEDLITKGYYEQEIPDDLFQKKNETRETWRDRLHHIYRVPIVLAALTDLKLPFVEVINPLLTKKIIYKVRELPDHLRTDKALFKEIVMDFSPNIPFAKKSNLNLFEDIVSSKTFLEFLAEELKRTKFNHIFPKYFRNDVFNSLKVSEKCGKKSIKSYVPKMIKSKLRRFAKPKKIPQVIAFRILLIQKMIDIIEDDFLTCK